MGVAPGQGVDGAIPTAGKDDDRDQGTDQERDKDRDAAVRLRRAAGQLAAVQRMHASGRPCIELIDQLHAVTAALNATVVVLAERHVVECVSDERSSAAAAGAVAVLRRVAR